MKLLFTALLAAMVTIAALPASAQGVPAKPGMSKGLGDSTYRSALYWNQNITLAGELTSTARSGAITSSSGGFGINTNTNELPGAAVAVLPKAGGLTGVVTKPAAMQAIQYWYDSAALPFVSQMATWLRKNGVSQGYFNFTQEVSVSTAAGMKKQALVWSGFVESTGRGVYGMPKLANPDPTFVEVIYWSRDSDDELPTNWTFQDGGKMKYRVLDKNFKEVTALTTVDLFGAYDEPEGEQSYNTKAIMCLVDSTGLTGCPSALNVRKLIDDTGSSGAILRYVRQLQPIYKDSPTATDPDAVEPIRAYSYEDRVWMCDKLENKGQFGFALEGTVDAFWVSESSPRYVHSILQSEPFQSLAVTEPFSVSATKAELGGLHPASVLISPFPKKELWRVPSPESAAAVYIAPIRVNPMDGAATMSPVTSDIYMSATVNGNVINYTIGSVGDNYFPHGVHVRNINFQIKDTQEMEEFRLLSAYWDDHLMIELNGHVMFIGPEHAQGVHYNVGDTGFDYFSFLQNYCYSTGEGGDYCSSYDMGGIGAKVTEAQLSCTVLRYYENGDSGYSFYETVDNRGPYDANGLHLGKGLCGNTDRVVKGKTLQTWEWARTWGVAPNLDMRPWLRNGANTFRVLLVAGGKGEFWFNIREKRQSCGEALGIPEGSALPLGGTATDLANQLKAVAEFNR